MKTCNIPSLTIGLCDLPWGHDGDMHQNLGDGFHARHFDAAHHARQAELAEGGAGAGEAS